LQVQVNSFGWAISKLNDEMWYLNFIKCYSMKLQTKKKRPLIFVIEESHILLSFFFSSSDILTLSRSVIPRTLFYYPLGSSALTETTYETIDSERFE
jgi:hypothetical protein